MTLIQPLKLAGPISVGLTGQPTKPQSEKAMDAGAFSKLLSSMSIEDEGMDDAKPADRSAKLEDVLVALEQLPIEELAPDQQELLSAMIELLSLQVAQEKMKSLGQQPDNGVQIAGDSTQQSSSGELPVGSDSPQQRMVELMQQIAHKVQELQTNPPKEFVNVPIFVGAEKEYILKEPNKVNEIIEVLEEVIPGLKIGQTEDLFKQTVSAEEAVKALPQKVESALAVAGLSLGEPLQQPSSGVAADAAIPPQMAAKPEASAPTPVVRMANLAEDLGDVLKNSLKLTGSGENAQIKVSIFPEHLGQLEIRLSTVDGKLAAQILTSNPMAKEALDMQVFQLRNALVQQGITVDRIEISQQATGQSFNHQQDQRFAQQQSQQRQASTKNGYQRLEEETEALVRPNTSDGLIMSVDYTI